MFSIFICMVEFDLEGIALQSELVRIISAKPDAGAWVFFAINLHLAVHHVFAVKSHRVEGVHPVVCGEFDANFPDGIGVVQHPFSAFIGLGGEAGGDAGDNKQQQFFHKK